MYSSAMWSSKAHVLFRVFDSVQVLEKVLERGDINVNLTDEDDETILHKSLKWKRSDQFIIRLLNANANLNMFNQRGESPLLAALRRPTFTVAREMINKGANVNAENLNHETALCRVIRRFNDYNRKAVYFLLYYGADVNVIDTEGDTPFLEALLSDDVNTTKILLHYYDGDLDDVLWYAIEQDRNIACKLIEMGANVNVLEDDNNLLEFALDKGYVRLFKLIWERFDYRIILNSGSLFLIEAFRYPELGTNDWVDCLNLVLNSNVAFKFARQCNGHGFFAMVLNNFYANNVKLPDRLRIIYRALSLSIDVELNDLLVAFKKFKFKEELDALLYCTDVQVYIDDFEMPWRPHNNNYYVLSLLLGIEDDLDYVKHFWSHSWLLKSWGDHLWVGYFYRSYFDRLLPNSSQFITEKVQSLPTFPSLMELSRTATRKFIRQAYHCKKVYQFHQAIQQLNLPTHLKDIVRFKAPIYL